MSQPVLTQTCVRRLQKEYRDLVKTPIPNLKIYLDPHNLLNWYFCIWKLHDPYQHGEFYGLISMNPDYPYKPPSYQMLTPNGRFAVKANICTTNSEFHTREWNPLWTMDSLFRGFLSLFLEDNSHGPLSHNHERSTPTQKQQYALNSIIYNRNHNPELWPILTQNEGVIAHERDLIPKPKVKLKIVPKN